MVDIQRVGDIGSDDLYISRDDSTTRLLALSVLDELVIGQDASAADVRPYWALSAKDYDYEIHADVLTIRGKISLPARSIKLFARILKGEKAGDTEPEICVDGVPSSTVPMAYTAPAEGGVKGQNCLLPEGRRDRTVYQTPHHPGLPGSDGHKGATGVDGDHGGKAGAIQVVFGSYQGSAMKLSAQGAAGHVGGSGQKGGWAGDGGDGGVTSWGVFVAPRQMVHWRCAAGAPGNGGDGGAGGSGGAGGAGGAITVLSVDAMDQSNFAIQVDGGAGGGGGPGGDGGSGGKWGNQQNFDMSWFTPPGSGTTGRQGAGGPTGGTGAKGTQSCQKADDCSSLFGFASYGHCGMLLERAKRDYACGDPLSNPAALDDAQLRLSWLFNVLYRFSDRSKTWTESDDVLGDQLFTIVFNLLRQLKGTRDKNDPLDVFGYRYDHVPFYPLNGYLKDIADAQKWFEDLETSYQGYISTLADHTQAQAKVQAVRDATQGALKAHRDQLKDAWAELNTLVKELLNADELMKDRKDEVLLDLKIVKQDLLCQTGCPSVDDITSGLQMLAFVPPVEKGEKGLSFSPAGGMMAGVEAYSLISKSVSTTSLVGSDGNPTTVPTGYVVDQIDSVDGTLTSLQASYTANKAGITLSPDCAKVLASAQSIDDTLGRLKVESAETARKSTDTYIEAITHRNALVLQYNERLAAIRKLSAEYDDLAKRDEKLGAKLIANSADVLRPEIVAWMGRAYEMTRANMLQMCYWLGRAYSFALLKDPPADIGALLKGDPRGLNSKTIDTLLTTYQRQAEIDVSVPAIFPADPACVINGGTGQHVLFKSDEVRARFRKRRSHVFTLIPGKNPLFTSAVSPFESLINVRIAAVCVWLDGIDLEPGQQMSIVVTRDGAGGDTFTAAADSQRTFTHGPIQSHFQCVKGKADGAWQATPAMFSTPAFDYTQKAVAAGDHAMPGPFGVWKIAIDQDACVDTNDAERKPLDLDKVLAGLAAIRVEFIGLSQAIQETTAS
jgi:hypothetical protein